LSTGVDATSARAVLTGCFRPLFLAIGAFHSESTRSRLHAGQLHRTLEEILAGADATARASGLDHNVYQQSKYAVVALADDWALHSDWDHAREWNRYLLEKRHFNSSFAGQEFFDRLNRLRQTLAGVQDPLLREQIAGSLEIYATCLRLGFQGRFRNTQGAAAQLEGMANGVLGLLLPQGVKAVQNRAWADAYGDGQSGSIVARRFLWWWPIPLVLLVAIGLWFVVALKLSGEIKGFDEKVKGQIEGGDPAASQDPKERR